MSALPLPAESLPVRREVDVLVAGGGSAGVAAAVSAARQGLETLLVEEMPFLGGMSTGGCVGTYCGFHYRETDGSLPPLVGGLPLEIEETLLARGHAYGPIPFKATAAVPYVPWGVKLLLEERVAEEPRLELLLHTRIVQAVAEAGAVRGVVAHGRSGRFALQAGLYVDATGDAALARAAGAETRVGDAIQYPSMMFTLERVDVPQALAAAGRLNELLSERFEADDLPRRSGNLIPTGRPGELLVALSRLAFEGRPVDASRENELTWGELEGRRQVERLTAFLKAHLPGFEEAFVADAAPRLGVRETHKIEGEATLTGEDVLGERKAPDGIGRSAWPIERHVPGGETEWRFLDPGTWYTIPWGCLVPRGLSNLVVAGRCLSADPDGFASVRVIGPCMLEGQAVGVAAPILLKGGTAARDLDVDQLRGALSALGVPL